MRVLVSRPYAPSVDCDTHPMFQNTLQIPRTALALIASLALFTTATDAQAVEYWPVYEAECEGKAFGDPGSSGIAGIDHCTRLWFAYVPPGAVEGDYGDRVKEAVRRLYREGSAPQAHLARQVLNRLAVTELPKRTGHSAQVALGEAVESSREKCDVPRPNKAAKKKANKAFKQGLSSYKKEQYQEALGHFLQMTEAAPGWTKSHYNVAAMYAKTDDQANMIKHLYCLRDIGTSDAIKALYRARVDDDFASIRDTSAPFKLVTGYARIKIGNSLGEYGEDNVDNLEAMLDAVGYDDPFVTDTSRPYKEPHVWYRIESRVAAYMVLKLLAHPKTRTHIIDWDNEDYDIIVAWGDAVQAGAEPKLYVSDPSEAEKTISDLRRQHEDAMRKPEQFARTLDQTLGTPAAIANDVSSTVDRTLETGKKLSDTVNKIINIAP